MAEEAAAARTAGGSGGATLIPSPSFSLDSLRAVLQEQIAPLNASTKRIEGRLEALEGNQAVINSRLDKLEATAVPSAAPTTASASSAAAAARGGADPLQKEDAWAEARRRQQPAFPPPVQPPDQADGGGGADAWARWHGVNRDAQHLRPPPPPAQGGGVQQGATAAADWVPEQVEVKGWNSYQNKFELGQRESLDLIRKLVDGVDASTRSLLIQEPVVFRSMRKIAFDVEPGWDNCKKVERAFRRVLAGTRINDRVVLAYVESHPDDIYRNRTTGAMATSLRSWLVKLNKEAVQDSLTINFSEPRGIKVGQYVVGRFQGSHSWIWVEEALCRSVQCTPEEAADLKMMSGC
jgi:hypothetical protein